MTSHIHQPMLDKRFQLSWKEKVFGAVLLLWVILILGTSLALYTRNLWKEVLYINSDSMWYAIPLGIVILISMALAKKSTMHKLGQFLVVVTATWGFYAVLNNTFHIYEKVVLFAIGISLLVVGVVWKTGTSEKN